MTKLKISEYIDNIFYNFNNHQIIFRGEPDYSWNLAPKLFREDDSGKSLYKITEKEMIDSFLLRFPEMRSDHKISILANMRHYGMPTRILDWTKNFLVALYFACEDLNYYDKDGAIYLYNCDNRFGYTGGSEFYNHGAAFCDFWTEACFIDSFFSERNYFLDFCNKWFSDWKKKSVYESSDDKNLRTIQDPRLHSIQEDLSNLIMNKKNGNKNNLRTHLNSTFAASDKSFFPDHTSEKYQCYLNYIVESTINIFECDIPLAMSVFGIKVPDHIIYLPHTNPRVTAQNAICTIHMGKIGRWYNTCSPHSLILPKYTIPVIRNIDTDIDNLEIIKTRIFKYKILHQDKSILKRELEQFFGISRGFLYPDDKVALSESLFC